MPEDKNVFGEEQKRLEELKKQASHQLLVTVRDIQSSLDVKAKEGRKRGEMGPEQGILEVVTDAIISFADSAAYSTVLPRRVRDEERVKLLPGQHGGISAIFINGGFSLRINVYGGLRATTASDMRDSDRTLANLHSTRTDRVLSQPTQVGWQIETPEGDLLCDSWIVYQLNKSFRLDRLNYQGEKIEINPVITNKAYSFDTTNKAFLSSVNNLLRLIPSSQ